MLQLGLLDLANIWDTLTIKNYSLFIWNSNAVKHPVCYLAILPPIQVLGLHLGNLNHIPPQTQWLCSGGWAVPTRRQGSHACLMSALLVHVPWGWETESLPNNWDADLRSRGTNPAPAKTTDVHTMAMNVLVNTENRKLWVVVQHATVYKAFAHHSFLPPIPLLGWQSRYCDHFLYFFAKPLQQSTTD